MTKTFEQRVIRERIVDTKTYRYIVRECRDHLEIARLPLSKLSTTAAINGWETVKAIYQATKPHPPGQRRQKEENMKMWIASDNTYGRMYTIENEDLGLSPIELAYKYGRAENGEIINIWDNDEDENDGHRLYWDSVYREYREKFS